MTARLIAVDCGITSTKIATIMRAIVSMTRDDLGTWSGREPPDRRTCVVRRPRTPPGQPAKGYSNQIFQESKEAVDSDVV